MELMKENEIAKEEKLLFNIVDNTLKLARKKISLIEVCIKKSIGVSVNVRNNIVENIEFHNDGSLFITVYNKFSKGSVSSKDFTVDGINNMIDKAIHISKYSSSDFFTGLPEIKLLYHDKINLDLFHPYVLSIEDIVKLVQYSENSAFKFDKKIVNSEGSFFNSYSNITVFGNSLGMLEKYKSTQYSISTGVIAKDKIYMERDFDYSISRKFNDLNNAKNIGENSAKRALSRLGARKIKTTIIPVIFSSDISSSIFSPLINAISGSNIYQKSTFLINCFQKRIFPEWLNIQEDPHIKKGLGSKPFDAEGVATYSKYIIKSGILKTWLLNSYFSKKLNTYSTGNSGGIYNWIISNTNISFQELLKKMNRGVLITELMGEGIDIISGNYSRGAVGFWVENGTIQYPINEITVSGNLKDMWNNIIGISSDINLRNIIQCGSILLSKIQISGN